MGRMCEVGGSSEVTHTPPQSTCHIKQQPGKLGVIRLLAPVVRAVVTPERGPKLDCVFLLQQLLMTTLRGWGAHVLQDRTHSLECVPSSDGACRGLSHLPGFESLL